MFIQKESKKPLYMQIYEYFRKEILTGNIKEGTKLPSIRQLTDTLKVSKNTINEAYQQLLAEGYIESKQKKGFWTVKLENSLDLPKSSWKQMSYPLSGQKAEEKIIDFQYGDINLSHFPIKAWKKNVIEAMDSMQKEVMLYGDKMGYFPLREEISRYLYYARGILCSPNQIVITAGTQYAVKQILTLFLPYTTHVAMENPGYDGVEKVLRKKGCVLKDINVCLSKGYPIEDLKDSHCHLAYVTPSHQFPLGSIMPIAKRIQLLQWANENNAYIMEDDYDSEFRYEGSPIQSLKGLDTNDRVIYLGTFSKSFLPAARVSYIVLPEKLAESVHTDLFETQAASPIIQKALYLFMQKGEFDRHLRKMRKIYQEKRTILVQSIKRYMGNRVEMIGENAGLHLLLVIKGEDTETLCEKAKICKINVYSAEKYYWTKNREASYPIMLGFGGLSKKEIEEGIRLMANVWFDIRINE
ncbi:MocR-like pyridoxine biosynthesis transcription factor PdxR [Niallia sp. 03133]|uniref:MocR-like pyridoxine biosynthesis transcription factor PdxR n=1 Tax=Niallia sp. 03133 TaxID=3458060 RepID=UPI004044A85A